MHSHWYWICLAVVITIMIVLGWSLCAINNPPGGKPDHDQGEADDELLRQLMQPDRSELP